METVSAAGAAAGKTSAAFSNIQEILAEFRSGLPPTRVSALYQAGLAIVLTPAMEPRLFAFLQRICELVNRMFRHPEVAVASQRPNPTTAGEKPVSTGSQR
jgi:hypothetical protein